MKNNPCVISKSKIHMEIAYYFVITLMGVCILLAAVATCSISNWCNECCETNEGGCNTVVVPMYQEKLLKK